MEPPNCRPQPRPYISSAEGADHEPSLFLATTRPEPTVALQPIPACMASMHPLHVSTQWEGFTSRRHSPGRGHAAQAAILVVAQ